MLATGLVAVVLVLLVAGVILAQAAVSAGRAATAADLAALAAADAARGISLGNPCTIAGEVASRNGAVLTSCAVSGPGGTIIEVTTNVPARGLPGAASGRARAGPPP